MSTRAGAPDSNARKSSYANVESLTVINEEETGITMYNGQNRLLASDWRNSSRRSRRPVIDLEDTSSSVLNQANMDDDDDEDFDLEIDLNDLANIQLKNISEVAAMALLKDRIERGSLTSIHMPVFRRNATVMREIKCVPQKRRSETSDRAKPKSLDNRSSSSVSKAGFPAASGSDE